MYTLPLSEAKTHYDNRLGEWLTFGTNNEFVLFYGLHGDEEGALFDQHKEPLTYDDLLANVPATAEKVFIAPCFPMLVNSQPHPELVEVLGYWTWPTCIETWDDTLHIMGYMVEEYAMDKARDLWQSVDKGELSQDDAIGLEEEIYDTFYPEDLDSLKEIPLLDYANGTYEYQEDY